MAIILLISIMPAYAIPDKPERVVKDLDYGDTLFEFFQQKYFTSIVHLTAAQKSGKINFHANEAELLLGGLYLSYGMHHESEKIFKQLIDDTTPANARNRAWFYLAKIQYQRGLPDNALATLKKIQGDLVGELEYDRRLLEANLLLRQKKYKEAAGILSKLKGDSSSVSYGQYNLGVALIIAGQKDSGIRELEKVGKRKASGNEMRALRDKSNLTLGYTYLQQENPEQAIKYLENVRIKGPQSNKALLGIGWAYSMQDKHRESLTPWIELRKRNVIDPSVQESLLATGYALNKIGAYPQSLKHYKNAITIYESEIERLDLSIQSIRNGNILDAILENDPVSEMGWFWELKQIPETPESRYIAHLLLSHKFQEALKNYRDLRFLHNNLDNWSTNMDIYDAMLDTRRHAYEERLGDTLSKAKLINSQHLRNKIGRISESISRINQEQDILSLANSEELRVLNKLDDIKDRLNALPEKKDTDSQKNKLRLMRGVLYWNIATDFKPRMWHLYTEQKQLHALLEENEHRESSLRQAQQIAPKGFEGFQDNISNLRITLSRLSRSTQKLTGLQEKYLEKLAVSELKKQQQRLSVYLTQARYAVAQIHDKASHQE